MKIKYVEWEKIFSSVINGDVDFAIADITYSKQRVEDNYGLAFTTKYRDNKQAIIGHKREKLKNRAITSRSQIEKLLSGKKVGAQTATINAEAANYLAKHFEIDVSSVYSSYTDVVEAVLEKKIDYGIIDSVIWESASYPELEELNIEIEQYLKDMYKTVLGTDEEFYSIAVSAKANNKDFVTLLNNLIESEQGKKKRRELEEKHRSNNLFTLERDKFECNERDREWYFIANALNKATPKTAFEMRKIFNETHLQRSGIDIQDIKQKLNSLGYLPSPSNGMKEFSSEITEPYIDAVIKFQKDMNMIHVDGIVGPYTKARLNQEALKKRSSEKRVRLVLSYC